MKSFSIISTDPLKDLRLKIAGLTNARNSSDYSRTFLLYNGAKYDGDIRGMSFTLRKNYKLIKFNPVVVRGRVVKYENGLKIQCAVSFAGGTKIALLLLVVIWVASVSFLFVNVLAFFPVFFIPLIMLFHFLWLRFQFTVIETEWRALFA